MIFIYLQQCPLSHARVHCSFRMLIKPIHHLWTFFMQNFIVQGELDWVKPYPEELEVDIFADKIQIKKYL